MEHDWREKKWGQAWPKKLTWKYSRHWYICDLLRQIKSVKVCRAEKFFAPIPRAKFTVNHLGNRTIHLSRKLELAHALSRLQERQEQGPQKTEFLKFIKSQMNHKWTILDSFLNSCHLWWSREILEIGPRPVLSVISPSVVHGAVISSVQKAIMLLGCKIHGVLK